jgi:Universal stress protein family
LGQTGRGCAAQMAQVRCSGGSESTHDSMNSCGQPPRSGPAEVAPRTPQPDALAADPSVMVEQYVTSERPAAALLDAAREAALLVVGCRGHGGFAGLLLGSVSQQVIHHAPCPVVVVR